MSYTYLSTEGDVDDTSKLSDETSLETVRLSANEPSSPTRPDRRSMAWIAAAISAVTILIGLSLFAFLSTNDVTPQETTEIKTETEAETTEQPADL